MLGRHEDNWVKASMSLAEQCSALRGLSLRLNKPIPNAWLGADQIRAAGFFLQLLPQVRNVNAEIMRLFHRLWPPDFREKLPMRENFACVCD